jgi:hypothetical protein
MAFLQRRPLAGQGTPATACPPSGSCGPKRTALWEYMCLDAYEDGQARKRSSVTVFTDGPDVKCMLKDRDAGMVLWSVGRTIDGALDALDSLLRAEDAPWRADRPPAAQGGSQQRKK